MKAKAYLETTIVSYLAASPNRDIVIAAHQQITREWWERGNHFELVVSQAVLEEAARGDAVVAARRAALLSGIPVLELGTEVFGFANSLLKTRAVPPNAMIDAVHIALRPSIAWITCSRGTVRIWRTPRFVARSNRPVETPAFRHP